MMTYTPEYTAVIVYYDTLVVALQLEPLEVANKLVAEEIIDPGMLDVMILKTITNYDKSSMLAYQIICQVKEDKTIFYRVVQCLSDISWTRDASKDLKYHLAGTKTTCKAVPFFELVFNPYCFCINFIMNP